MQEQRPWPATDVEIAAIETLIPYASNARTHSEGQIAHVADLMLRFGVTTPILRDEAGTIVAGHARVRAALLNLARGHDRFAKLPVMTARGWTEDEKRAYVIADNQSALMAGWDFGMLSEEIQALSEAAFDTSLLGFSDADLRRMTGYAGGLTNPDDVPGKSGPPVSKAGDLWVLGEHRLLCGSAIVPGDVQKLFAGKRPALMVTDPPYGVNYDPSWRSAAGVSASARTGKVQNDDRADWREAWVLFSGDVAYIWHAGKFASDVQQSLEANNFEVRAQIIWRKAHFAIGRGDYHWQHEPCWYAVRKGGKRKWKGDRKQSTVWDIAGVVAAKGPDVETADSASTHGTQKPVECMRRPIENNSDSGDIVYDPFLGSGTTIIAAEQCGRLCFGLEIDPSYVDVVVRRWQNFTGRVATLESSGATFAQIELERNFTPDGSKRPETPADSAANN